MMSLKFIFAFMLLVTFSMVNAVPPQLLKRVTTFEPCAKTPLDVTKIVPDPLVSGKKGEFYVSGKFPKAIPKDYVLIAAYFDVSTDTPKLINLNWATVCKPDGPLKCPFPAETPFSVILGASIPALPPLYGILVAIGDINLNVILGCATALSDAAPKTPEPAALLSSIQL